MWYSYASSCVEIAPNLDTLVKEIDTYFILYLNWHELHVVVGEKNPSGSTIYLEIDTYAVQYDDFVVWTTLQRVEEDQLFIRNVSYTVKLCWELYI